MAKEACGSYKVAYLGGVWALVSLETVFKQQTQVLTTVKVNTISKSVKTMILKKGVDILIFMIHAYLRLSKIQINTWKSFRKNEKEV